MISDNAPVDARLRVETVQHEQQTWIAIQGEADIAGVRYLEAALASVQLDGTRSVHVDVSHLEFCDVAALRRLVEFARQAKQSGYRITTGGATPMLTDVAYLLGVHDDLGLDLH